MAYLLTKIKDLYLEARGFKTDRRLVVLESDDWGSIRMPSRLVLEHLQTLGDHPEANGFLRNDSLESEGDLLALYEVLRSVTDKQGRTPLMTMNFAMANPDFDRIDYKEGIYAYEPFHRTYTRYYGENRVMELIREGIDEGLILPQLHCREHLNVGRWMRDLREGRADALLSFEHRTMGVGASFHEQNRFGYMDAFHTDCSSEEELAEILRDAVSIFERSFGYPSKTFVASCYVWGPDLEKTLKEQGILCIQGAPWQNLPAEAGGGYRLKRRLHYMGERNRNGQIYGVRNCNYEPAYRQDPKECVASCLEEIERAFCKRMPAVICTHRFNFIGSINSQNREENLQGLRTLLREIVKRYPDAEFLSSAELFNVMEQERS